jgi:hypothetical protein
MADDVAPPQPLSGPTPETRSGDYAVLRDRLEKLEQKAAGEELDAEAQHRRLLITEVRQRINVRNWVVAIAITVLIFMACVLAHAAHRYFLGPFVLIPPTLAIVMFIAPVVSITTITIMLLIGAFRRFKDDDMGKIDVASLTAEALKASQGS